MSDSQYTFFFSLKSPFSNFHPARIEYKDYVFCSNEQFMMFGKAKTFNDEETALKILAVNNNQLIVNFLNGTISAQEIVNNESTAAAWNRLMMEIKKCGRGVKNYKEDVWCQKRENIVRFGAKEKFRQNQDLFQELMGTGNSKMVEASKYDKIWGIGLSEADAKKIPTAQWPGLNLLGNVLDSLKVEFANTATKRLKI